MIRRNIVFLLKFQTYSLMKVLKKCAKSLKIVIQLIHKNEFLIFSNTKQTYFLNMKYNSAD